MNDIPFEDLARWVQWRICWVLGHRYRLKRKISKTISEVQCLRCKKEFGINYSVKALIPLDEELRVMHEDILADKPFK